MSGTARPMKLQRLRHMELSEILGRTRQQASKWLDRTVADGSKRRTVWTASDGRVRREGFRESVRDRFFAGTGDESTPALLADRMPAAMREIVAGADRARAGRFDLLGYRGLSFGDPIDWHLDPVSRKRAPLVHWSRLDPLDVGAVGDSKVVWELSRHQWLVGLGEAYRMTGDERYAAAFAAYVDEWLAANPVGHGINWASSLEVALRLIAWCWALALFEASPALTPDLFARLQASIEEHASHVERYLSHYFSPNTHLTGEALGLFYAGTVFPELNAAARWRARAARILADEMVRQVLPDGVYFEQSTCYQRYTIEILLHFLILGGRSGFDVPSAMGERAQAMLDFLLTVRPTGAGAPAIGDADGGWLLPLARREPDDLGGVFAVAAALFHRPDYAWAAGEAGPEVLWLLGSPGLAAFDTLRPAAPARPASRIFADGGYAVMRGGWEPGAPHLVFDVGPLGCPVSGGHGHADLLSVQCWAFGQPFLVDPGTGTYAEEPWRGFFRGSAAHSTVTVDDESQAVPVGPFGWKTRPRARLLRWVCEETFDFADGDHDGYLGLPDPVRHRRRVLFVKPRYWVLLDDLEGMDEHRVELRFQFAAIPVTLGPGPWARAEAGGRQLLVRSLGAAPLEVRIQHGARDPIEGWVSPDYGQRRPAPVIVYSTFARLPLRLITLLLPSDDPFASPPDVFPIMGKQDGLVGLAFAGGESVRLDAAGDLLVHFPGPGAAEAS
ncbi:MAG: hypothetical protein DMF78_02495 [Acidobacteria bacterium]|nr:MAG: hypothetical protein DMF78_02495 [Acidobacteriota bacterium]